MHASSLSCQYTPGTASLLLLNEIRNQKALETMLTLQKMFLKKEMNKEKDGCFFEKKGSASPQNKSSHAAVCRASIRHVVVVPKGKIYLQLVLDCITGVVARYGI